jgi:predicted nuclease of predicted toxin-antitoxin system
MRTDGHDVVYIAERAVDPGDAAILAEAHADRRVLITKDHDIGALVFRDGAPHAGVVLIDDLGDVAAETRLLREVLTSLGDALLQRAFVRFSRNGSQIVSG